MDALSALLPKRVFFTFWILFVELHFFWYILLKIKKKLTIFKAKLFWYRLSKHFSLYPFYESLHDFCDTKLNTCAQLLRALHCCKTFCFLLFFLSSRHKSNPFECFLKQFWIFFYLKCSSNMILQVFIFFSYFDLCSVFYAQNVLHARRSIYALLKLCSVYIVYISVGKSSHEHKTFT